MVRSQLLYIFLLIVPFFNIIIHRLGPGLVLTATILFILLNFSLTLFQQGQAHYKRETLKVKLKPLYFILFLLIISLILSQLYLLIARGEFNYKVVLFFGSFIPILIYFFSMCDLNNFFKKYLNKILVFYILAFSISIIIDYAILHSRFDLALQPMYDEASYSYVSRPFGITGQPSVNSVLLVFFYTFFLSTKSKSKILFIFVTVGVALQGSGSGFIAYLMLLVAMLRNAKYIYKSLFFLLLTFLIPLQNKISFEYIQIMTQVFINQTQDWLYSLNSYLEVLFGGNSSAIDFGILFLISNIGLIYFLVFSSLFMYLILKADSHYDRMAIYILLIGNLHYPVLFYLVMVFILPLFIYKVLYVRINSN